MIRYISLINVPYLLVINNTIYLDKYDEINSILSTFGLIGEHLKDIREQDYFTEHGDFRVDKTGSPISLNCLMYKLCYYCFEELQTDFRSPLE